MYLCHDKHTLIDLSEPLMPLGIACACSCLPRSLGLCESRPTPSPYSANSSFLLPTLNLASYFPEHKLSWHVPFCPWTHL